jgi:hypothetical protein
LPPAGSRIFYPGEFTPDPVALNAGIAVIPAADRDKILRPFDDDLEFFEVIEPIFLTLRTVTIFCTPRTPIPARAGVPRTARD